MKKSTIIEICLCIIIVLLVCWIFYKSVAHLDNKLTEYSDEIDKTTGMSNEIQKTNSEVIITNTIEKVNSERIMSNTLETNEIQY